MNAMRVIFILGIFFLITGKLSAAESVQLQVSKIKTLPEHVVIENYLDSLKTQAILERWFLERIENNQLSFSVSVKDKEVFQELLRKRFVHYQVENGVIKVDTLLPILPLPVAPK